VARDTYACRIGLISNVRVIQTSESDRLSEWVFAYGSNMWSARLRDYSVTPEEPGQAAVLEGYHLLFNKWSKKHQSGKANVEPNAAAAVWGVLYSIPDNELEMLDKGEGAGYTRAIMVVASPAGHVVKAWIYHATPNSVRPGARPFTWYRDLLILGAKEHGLPAAYIAQLEAIDAIPDPDPAREAERRELM
jgi:gamma-glutamylcyclotransferase